MQPEAQAAFDLEVKDASSGRCSSLRVEPSTKVVELKHRLLRERVVSPCSKLHLAHNGRVLQDAETLADLALVPKVVMACINVSAPAPTAPPPDVVAAAAAAAAAAARRPASPPPSQPTPLAAAAPASAAASERSNAIARAWDRAFPQQQQQPAAQEEEDERICRVCFCGEEAGRLFVPCRCRGSMKYVHPHCLNEWRATSVNARSYTHCDQCGYRYQTERTAIADFLQSEVVVWCVSLLLVVAVAVAGSLLPGRPERLLFALLEWEPSARSWWGGAYERACVALMWPGVLGAGYSMLDAYHQHRGIPVGQQGWISALVLSFAANGKRISRVLVACGLLYFLGRLAGRLRLFARRLLTRFGDQILEAVL